MKAFFVLLLLFVVSFASGQELMVGTELSGTLEPTSKDVYTLESSADYYVYGYADQLTVDVVVTVFGPDGRRVGAYDGPSRGPGAFQFTATMDGTYRLEVESYQGAEGDYKILVVANEPKAEGPEAYVDQMMTPFSGEDQPGVSIAVLKNGELVLARGYGMANLAYGVPLTENTGMSIASASKQFTAMAILLLQNDGLLSLDDDVRQHIPELKDFGTPVTLRHMLNHTSGYRDILNLRHLAGRQYADVASPDESIRIVQRQAELQSAPGTLYSYNNTTFGLLTHVVERVSGVDFKSFMEQRVFEPLGMNDTTIKMRQGQVIPNSSQGYELTSDGEYRAIPDFDSMQGASGVNTTAVDMTKWMLNYRDALVGGEDAIRDLTTRGVLASGDTLSYALGLRIGPWRGQPRYHHSGGENSHASYVAYFPEIESGVFVSSANPGFNRGVWSEIADAFFGEYFDPIPEPGDSPASAESEEEPEIPELTDEEKESFVGRYFSEELETMYTIKLEEGEFKLHHRWYEPFSMTHVEGDEFLGGRWFIGSIKFQRDEAGSVSGFMAGNSRVKNLLFEKVK